MMGNILVKLLLGILIFSGIFFRLWNINKAPIELFGDELDVGLQAYSILTTGKDYLGNNLPILFHSFSEYRLPMQLYLSVPFIKLFGLNEFGVRGTSVLMGFISILFLYLLVAKLFNNRLGIIAVLLMLFSPWHFNFSRQANDAGILLPFVLAGTFFFLKGLKNYKYLMISSLLFALSIYTYAVATLFVPLLGISLLIIYRKEVFKTDLKKFIFGGLIGLVVLIPYIKFTLQGISSERFSVISVSSGDSVFQEVVDKRRWSSSLLTRVFYNTKTITFNRIFNNYLASFSTNFLFFKGDPNMRQGIEGFGQMYYFDILLIAIGGFYSLYLIAKRKEGSQKYLLIILWLLVSPIPSAMTKDGGSHASRLILMLPPLILLSSLGFDILLKSAKTKNLKIVLGIFIVFMFYNGVKFIHRYFIIWPNESARFWQYGYKEGISYVKSVDSRYDRIIINNTYEPALPRFLFYYQFDMNRFQKEFKKDVHEENILPHLNGFLLSDKYYFGELIKPIESLATDSTLVFASADIDATDPSIFTKYQAFRLVLPRMKPDWVTRHIQSLKPAGIVGEYLYLWLCGLSGILSYRFIRI